MSDQTANAADASKTLKKKEIPDEEKISAYKARRVMLTQRFEGFSFKMWVAIGYIIAVAAVGGVYAYLSDQSSYEKKIIPFSILGAVAGITGYSFFTFFARLNIQNSLRWIDFKLAKLGIERLSENIKDDFFTKLVQINFKYIDEYYMQTQEQAAKSFRLAVFASVSGLVVLLTGIMMMYIGTSNVSTGIIASSAGVISQFISAVFFYLYNQTIVKMSQYHQKLVITQNVSLALKITDGLDKESKTKSLELLIDRLTIDVNKFLVSEK